MGEVYEAEDQELRTSIALKTIVGSISDDPVAIRRLKAEVHLARRVSHPNVCRIFDLGIDRRAGPAGEVTTWFLSMELLVGSNLGQRIRRDGRMPPPETAAIGRQLAEALAAAHRVGVVHRDFKSDNVIVVPSAEAASPRAMVTDFGLAREMAGSRGSVATSGGMIVGTAAYMAPEQVEGRSATAASDVYALGVVLFEMLTGELPFTGRSSFAAAVRRLHEEPPLPRALVPTLDPRWNALVSRCLARDPTRRFASADEVAAALDALAPVHGVGTARRSRPRRPLRRPFVVGIAGGAALAATLLVLANIERRAARPGGAATDPGRSPSPPLPASPRAPAKVVDKLAAEPLPPPVATTDVVAPKRPRTRPRREATVAPAIPAAESPPQPRPSMAAPVKGYQGVIDPFK